ncbi:Glutathione S-transferase [Candidatus Rhodobacter oscarellae]|uniref:Glutathione S-transferase n=1 Tax=Candidatus Rhodobacter oscarellae TaxID=1675527 RepID=A0A0J9E7I6_9RHOB|nr:glutathione S-transferase family protein [Candidatus Rhodobacter lobularis]KMW58662.1 Glutathione S-transferase [Candidatus Rhodobacter lobularis]
MSQFTLYDYVLSGNCYKIRLMAGLLNVAYDTVPVDFYPGLEHRGEAMRALNPSGTLPVLVAGELILSETQSMLGWLAASFDRSGMWYPVSDAGLHAQVLQWLGFSARLTASVGAARLNAMLDWPTDIETVRGAARKDLDELEVLLTDRVFAGQTWLVGDGPTIADIACFPYVALSPDAGFEHDGYPAIRNWLYAVRSLPGFVTMPGIHPLHELREAESDG